MTYKRTEKEIIRVIVKYERTATSLGKALTLSALLENYGIVLVTYGAQNYIFYDKSQYQDCNDKYPVEYIAELLSLVDTLIKEKYITIVPSENYQTLIIGKEKYEWIKLDKVSINDGQEFLILRNESADIIDKRGFQKYWSCIVPEQQMSISNMLNRPYAVSQKLKEFVKHNFKSEEEIRYKQQQYMTWISIFVAIIIGILGIVF